jgi:exonuclease III
MMVISWNTQGINFPGNQVFLKRIIVHETPSILMLQETKCDEVAMSTTTSKCWRNNESMVVSVVELGSGLDILWDPTKVKMEHFLSSPNLLTINYRLIESQDNGFLTNAYGHVNPLSKGSFLNSLVTIKELNVDQPWLIGGDFNMITSLHGNRGGNRGLENESVPFKAMFENIRLVNIQTSNGCHTWNNKCGGACKIVIRLE